MYFDRYDIAEAYYCFLLDYHEGGGSDKYRRLSRIGRYFKPRPNLSYDTLSENAKSIYQNLVNQNRSKS